MSSNEYKFVYKKFLNSDDVFYVSEHRKKFYNKLNLKNSLPKNPDIVLMPIS